MKPRPVDLPVRDRPARPPMPAHEPRLLLVDDDPSAIQVLSRMLAQYPHQRFAKSGADALRLAREAPPDLILLDADMPGMTGLEVCDALKADAALAHVPVIFVTSHDAPHLEVAALERGAVDFITKPLVAAQVTARVRARLRLQRLIDHAQHSAAGLDGGLDETGAPRPRLLIVDDDVGAVRLLHHTLAAMGTIHCATAGDEAVRMARHVAPDLILIDAQMPGMDGLAVCETLKAERAFKDVPIVFVTRFCDPRTERRAFEAGAADFISKPFPPAVVQARVRSLLEQKRHADKELLGLGADWRSVGQARVAEIVDAASDAILSHEAASRVTAQMLCCIAHEMGNPLNGVMGFAQLMAADTDHPLPAKQAERLQLILDSAERLRVLTRDITELGRNAAGGLTVDAVDTAVLPCVQAAVAAVESLASQAGVTVVTVANLPHAQVLHAVVDGGRLQQCLANLLTNAIKYNRPGGWVGIELQEQGKNVAIAVRDNGLGMDALQLEHLFEPFNRLGRQRSATPGMGLGLTITRTLAHAMGGQLAVESQPDQGSCFTLLLPRAIARSA